MVERQAPGPKNRFRPKVRSKVITFTMTALGHKGLEKLLAESPDSRADVLERLIRKAAGIPLDA